jgi:hypothetical protein
VYCTNIKSTTIYKRINKIKERGNTYGVKWEK